MLSPPFIIYYMGCCNDCLTCDIAFNAVMPLSRASTRGSYSRIEGVTRYVDEIYGLEVKLQVDAKRLLLIRAGFHRYVQESRYEYEQVMNTART